MKRVANILFGLVILALFVVILPINHDKISFQWWSGWESHVPLAVLLLFTFLLGMTYTVIIIGANFVLGAVDRAERRWSPRTHRKARRMLREGNRLVEKGRLKEAEEKYNHGLKLHERSSELHAALGKLYELSGRLNEAAKSYGRASAYNHDDPELLFEYGRLSIDNGEPATAAKALRSALKIDPGHINAMKLLPAALADEARYDEAVTAQEAYIKALPKSERSGAERDLLAYRTEHARRFVVSDPSKAARTLSDVLKKDPAYLPAALTMAEIHQGRGKREEAFEVLVTAFKSRPEPFLYCRLADMEVEGVFERTEEIAEEVLRGRPRLHGLRIAKARVRLERNLAREALGELEKISGDPAIEELVVETSARLKLSEIEEAKRAINLAVDNLAVDYRCSECGYRDDVWSSRCAGCGAYNTMTACE